MGTHTISAKMIGVSQLLLLSHALVLAASLSFPHQDHQRARREVSPEWAQQWEQVNDVVPNPPPQKLFVEWPNNVRVEPMPPSPPDSLLEDQGWSGMQSRVLSTLSCSLMGGATRCCPRPTCSGSSPTSLATLSTKAMK